LLGGVAGKGFLEVEPPTLIYIERAYETRSVTKWREETRKKNPFYQDGPDSEWIEWLVQCNCKT
jgi:hypothetical protein